MNWYIGQDVVALKTIEATIIKDKIYIIRSLRLGFCSCSKTLIDIGLNYNHINNFCEICNVYENETGDIHWLSESLFAPLDSLVNLEEIESLKEQFEKV